MIYLDNNATTQPAPEVVAAMLEVNEVFWSNPSSVHRFGQQVRQRMELARAAVARLIGAKPREVLFTSGGTESNNLALWGILPDVLITTGVEHSAIREPAEAFADTDRTVVNLPVGGEGLVSPHDLAVALEAHGHEDRTVLISIQWANNETGVLLPVAEFGGVVAEARQRAGHNRQSRIFLHVDATQAVGKIPVDVEAAGIDLLTASGHKFHGPKGVGVLWLRRRVPLAPMQRGGPQESEKRGGTENTAGIIGMGVAADLAATFLADRGLRTQLAALRDRFEQTIVAAVDDTTIHGASTQRLWNTSNIAFSGLEAEAILLSLSERGVYASAGAACSSGSLDPSPVLLAMGVPEPVAHGSVRFSLSRDTTADEIDEALAVVPNVVQRLQKTMPMGG